MRRLVRTVNAPRPADIGRHDGLAYTLWMPAGTPRAGVVILHGAGSCKESHHDFARRVIADGLAAIAFDQRGHGESDGPMDGRALEDVASIADVLRSACEGAKLPMTLRGSSMGGCFALLAAPLVDARAVVAIAPASPAGMRRALHAGTFRLNADVPAVDALLGAQDLHHAVASLEIPVLLLHAAGDEQVPAEHSRELARELRSPASRLIVVPGGHHRSVQHDAELQAFSLRFLEKVLG
jgi:alpha-beta hydrolase superfamily lysophospholipase